MTQNSSVSSTSIAGAATSSGLLRVAVVLGMLAALVASATGCSSATPPATTTQSAATQQTAPAETQSTAVETSPAVAAQPEVTKLVIKDIKVGKGATAKTGKTVTVDYTGWLMDGTKFDSSIGGQPFSFALGTGYVIPGWDKGVVGMKVGGTRTLIIPAAMAYGEQGSGSTIPPNAPLKFEVKLLAVK